MKILHRGWLIQALIVFILGSAMVSTMLAPVQVSAQESLTGKIVFCSNRDGNSEIYVTNIDGSNQINLTNNPASDGQPRWSPDAKRIVFASGRDGNSEIYVMDANGANPTNLTNNPGKDTDPDWSPDGRHVVFVSDRDGNNEIYIMDADGNNQVNLTNDAASDRQPVWSPDGSRIAFVSERGYSSFDEVYTMNVNGTNVTKVGSVSMEWILEYLTDWSADGKYLTITRRAPLCPHTLKLLEIERDIDRKVREKAGGGSFSPDGSQLVFAYIQDENWEICLLDIETNEIISRLTFNNAGDWDPDWSPEVPPLAPSSLRSASVSPNEIRFNWQDNSDNELGFKIERKEYGGSWQQIATVATNVNSYSDSSVSPETSQSYRVKAYNRTRNSDYSNTLTVETPVPPIAKEASSAIAAAESSIAWEKSKGFDMTRANQFLLIAKGDLKYKQYEHAFSVAHQAAELALDIDLDGTPNEEDFAPTVKNGYIYAGGAALLLCLIWVSAHVYKKRRRKRVEEKNKLDKAKKEVIDMIDEALEEEKTGVNNER